MHNKEKGFYAENVAAKYLSNKGYKILFRNWTCRWGELDLVMLNNGILTFIEVKYRTTKTCGDVFESLTTAKKRHLKRTINLFLKQESTYRNYENWCFELICITKRSSSFLIDHYKSLFLT